MYSDIVALIEKYKCRIAVLQRKQKTFESRGQGGVCISLQGEIQAYNVVIIDLIKLTNPK